ncbi:hypothetical protein AB0N99_30655 [Streptomyces sp. NPDC093272]|uniref:hypothetical protein n=1 Tax=Streptomyces sp. NPDC093272 TaxID=3154981 RepID=UPI0034478CBA
MRDVRVLSPRLPFRTRAQLAIERQIDGVCGWLADHRCTRVAEWMWRLCGMW